jgi:site-specific DNA recombinase
MDSSTNTTTPPNPRRNNTSSRLVRPASSRLARTAPTIANARERLDRLSGNKKLERYRSLLDEAGDVAIAARWINETQKERRALEAQLGQHVPGGTITPEQVKALVTALKDIVSVLTDAEPAARADVYNDLGVHLRYTPDGMVAAQAQPRGVTVRVGGGT